MVRKRKGRYSQLKRPSYRQRVARGTRQMKRGRKAVPLQPRRSAQIGSHIRFMRTHDSHRVKAHTSFERTVGR